MAALAQLQRIENELAGIKAQQNKQQLQLLQGHLDAREDLLKRRYELVSGQSAATDEELQGYTGPRTTGPIKPQGVPCFWLNALCADDEVGPCITASDRAALAYLQDIRYIRGKGGLSWSGMMLEFHFAENPFFENKVLRKGVSVQHNEEGEVVGASEEGTRIEWKDGQSLLVRKVKVKGKKAKQKAKQRKGGANKGGGSVAPSDDPTHTHEEDSGLTRVKPVPSFFRFFIPLQKPKVTNPAFDIDQDDSGADEDPSLLDPTHTHNDDTHAHSDSDPEAVTERLGANMAAAEAAQRKGQRDMAILNAIVKRVIPRAVHLYMAAPQGPGAEDEDSEWGYQVVSNAAAAAHGGGAALPAASQQALHAITRLQTQLDAFCAELKAAKWKLAQETDVKEQALLDDRAAIVKEQASKAGGLSLFWLRALRASDASAAGVAHRDELALSYLTDVRVRLDWSHMPTQEEPWRKAKVEWTFAANPYFPATTLTKEYTLTCQHGSASNMSLEQAGLVLSAPQWTHPRPRQDPENAETDGNGECDLTPGQCDLTLDASFGDGGTKIGSGKKRDAQPVAATSFFNMFKKGCLRHAFSQAEDSDVSNPDEAALQAEGFLIQTLLNELRYKPTELYDLVEIDIEDLGHEYNEIYDDEDESLYDGHNSVTMSEGGSHVSEEEGEEGSGDEQEGAMRRPRRRPKSQRSAGEGGGSYTKYYVFVALMLLMVASQLVMYIDMFTAKKR